MPIMPEQAPLKTVTAPEFVAAVFATLALAGERRVVDFGAELDQHFERAFDRFVTLAQGLGFTPNFTLRTNKFGGDSSVFRECLYMMNRRDLIIIHNPDHRIIDINISAKRATQMLDQSMFSDPTVREAILDAMTS